MEINILTFDNIDDFIKYLKENFDSEQIAYIIENNFQYMLDNAVENEEYEQAIYYRDLINAAVKLVEGE
jgi:protein-arginine kinase activator protein McsA